MNTHKLSKKELHNLSLKNRKDVMELVYEIKFADNPKLAQRLKDKLKKEYLKKVQQ